MVAIVSGNHLGLQNASLSILGGLAGSGNAVHGRGGERVYVNSATGNLIIQNRDEYVSSRGLDLSLTRTYNSQGLLNDDNGDNWRLSVHLRLTFSGTPNGATSTVTKLFGDGAELIYRFDSASQQYVSSDGAGAHDTLRYDVNSGRWTWTDGSSRATETYDATGKLLSSADADGNTTTYTYTGQLLTQIVDASGQTTTLRYTGNNLTDIQVVVGGITQTRTRYAYDTSNRLTSVTVDLTLENTADARTYVTTYTYDGTSKRVATIGQSDGGTVRFTYEQVAGQYRVKTFTDEESRVTTLNYTTGTGSALQVDIVDPLGLTTTYISDASGRLTDVLQPAVNGTRMQMRYGYDAAGNLISITEDLNGLNLRTTLEYDARGNLLLSRDAPGNTITRTYSATNQLLTETRYTVADTDGAGSAQPSGALTTRYIYDSAAHLRFVMSPDGRLIEHRYDSFGNRTATLHYTAARYNVSALTISSVVTEAQLSTWVGTLDMTQLQRVDYAYNGAGNLTTATAYSATNSTGAGVASTASITRYVYDQRGQLLQQIDPRGEGTADTTDYLTSYTYDSLERLLTTTEWLAAGKTRTTTSTYDDANRRSVTTYANGLVTTSLYDRTGRLLSEARASGTLALGTTTYTYDADGRLRVVTDPTGLRQHIVYDAAGRKQFEVDRDGTLTEYVYGRTGLLVKTIQYAVAANTALLIDTAGVPLNAVDVAALRNSAAGSAASDRITRNVYDAAGQLIFTIDEDGAVSERRYDGASRLTDVLTYANRITIARASDELPVATVRPLLSAHAEDRRTRYFYDSEARLVATLDAAGNLIEQLYDGAGNLSGSTRYAIATTAALRANGTLTDLRPATAALDIRSYFFYDGQGRRIGALDGEGYFTETVYDTAGYIAQTTRFDRALTYPTGATPFQSLKTAATGAPSQTISYLYDGGGRVTRQTDHQGTITTFAYDDANNLISSTRAATTSEARTTQVRYDALGRVLQELSAEGSALITASMTQADIDAIWSRYAVTYAYDLAGRKISATLRPSDTQTITMLYFYDNDGRLRFEVNALGERTEYRYNALNQLTDKIAYSNRIATTGLSGGLLTSALVTTLTATADSARDGRITYQYTLTGRLASERVARTTSTGEDSVVTYAYNAFGDRTVAIEQIDATRTLRHDYTYDARGQVTLTRWDAAALNTTETRKYDAFGRLTERTDQRGKIWGTKYDRLGRVIATTDPGTPDRVTTYDAFDRIVTRRDALGNATTYAYDAVNRRMTITSPSGIVTTHTENRHGETVTVTDGRGNPTSYTYDLNGRLRTVTTPAGVTSSNYDRAGQRIDTTDANGIRTVYTYDAAGRVLTRTVDPTGLALTTKTFYDGRGQAVWQQDANGVWTQTLYNGDGEVTAVIVDPATIPNASSTQTAITTVSNSTGLNLRTEYTYDFRGKTLTVTEGAGSAKPKVTAYTYDALGRRTQEAVDPAGLNLRTTYTYDAANNLVAKTNALSTVDRYVYDDKNQLIYSVDATGAVVKTDYDAEGRVIQRSAYANTIRLSVPSVLGLAITAADVTSRLTINATADQVTHTVYDREGRVAFSIDAMKAVTKREYDAAGNVIQVTRYATPITIPATLAVTAMGNVIVANANNDRAERFVYDAANRATFQIDALNYVTQSVYDGVGQVIKQVRYDSALAGTFTVNQAPQIVSSAPTSGSYVIVNAAKDRVTRTIYDGAGRARFTVNAEGYVTERRYDKLGHETTRIQYAAQYTVADGASVTSITAQLPATPGTNEAVTQSLYDAAGRLLQVTDAEGVITRHVHDAVGRETDTTVAYGTADASTTRRVFDNAGRLIEQTAGFGSPEAATWRYELDAVGNRIKLIDPRAIELAETDSAWAQKARTAPAGTAYALPGGPYPQLVANLTPAQKAALRALYTTTQQFDANGRVTAVIDATGKPIATLYDAFGNAVRVTDQRGNIGYFYFDRNNRQVVHVDPEGYVTRTIYNAFGAAEQTVRFANKVVGTVAVGSPPAIVTSAAASGAYVLVNAARDQTTRIEYDRRGSQVKITDAENNFETMAYDALGNKISYRNKLGGVFQYTFDRVGNVKQETSPRVSIVTVNSNGTLNALQLPIVKDFSYDARGNLTFIREGVTGQQRDTMIVYDRLNREVRRNLPAIAVFNPTSRSNSTQTTFTETTYDRRGNVVELRQGFGAVTTGRVLNYYDALNRKIASVNEDGALTFDDLGNITFQRRYATLSEYTFDDVGNVTLERTYATRLPTANLVWTARPMAVANDTYREMEYVYDANNRRTEELMQRETFADMTRLLTQSSGNTSTTASMYVTGQTRTSNVYDAAGNLVKVVDGRGYFSLYFYNRLGQRILSVDPFGYVTQLEYDANGNIVRQSRYEQKLSGATLSTLTVASNPQTAITEVANRGQDRVTEYTYDRMSRKTGERILSLRYSTVNEAGQISHLEGDVQLATYAYDAAGNLTRQIKADGSQTDYDYDLLSRVIRKQDPNTETYSGVNGNTVLTTTVRARTEWQYDALGNQTVETRFGLTAANDQITRSQFDAQGNVIAAWDALDNRTDYDVDAAGNILRATRYATDVEIDGVSLSHTYRTYFTYDALGRELSRQILTDELTSIQVTGDTSWTSYNAFGDVAARGLNNTTQAEYRYDKRGKLFWTNADTGTPRVYVYDASGNAVLEISQVDGVDLNALVSPGQMQSISPLLVQIKFSVYDARNQIKYVFQPPMNFTGLTGGLTADEQPTPGAPTQSIDEHIVLRDPPPDDPAATVSQTTRTTPGTVWQTWTRPPDTVWTALDPTAVNYDQHGQHPIQLGTSESSTSREWQTENPPVSTVEVTAVKNVRARLADGQVRETITTTTTTTATRRDNSSEGSEDVNHESGSASGGQTNTSREIVTTTVHVHEEVRDYSSAQVAYNATGVVGGNAINTTQLRFYPQQRSIQTNGSVRYGTPGGPTGDEPNYVHTRTVSVPSFEGVGSGPLRIVAYSGSSAVAESTVANGGPATVTFTTANMFTTRYEVWRGSLLLANVNPNAVTGAETFETRRLLVLNDVPGTNSISLSHGSSAAWFNKYDFNGSVQWIAADVGNTTEQDWQYIYYSGYGGSGNILCAARVTSLTNPDVYIPLLEVQTRYEYLQQIRNDELTTEDEYQDVTGQIEQSNYLRRLLYSVISGESHENQILRSSTYNAFAEISGTTDGRGKLTEYEYNELGTLIRKIDPPVSYRTETGQQFNDFRPITDYHVDKSGRTIGSTDANGFTTRQLLRNGRLAAQFNPGAITDADGGVERHYYDTFGNLVATTNATGLTTRYEYDKNNRLTLTDFAGDNYDSYKYDALGNRIEHTNGIGARERYNYDAEGRITRYRSAANRETRYSYQFRADIGERGGYRKITTDPMGGVLTEDIDMFGKMRRRVDLNNREYLYQYNAAGWLTKQSSSAGQNIEYTYYRNGYLHEVRDLGINSYSLYEYDEDGNRTLEAYSSQPFANYASQSPTGALVSYGLAPQQLARATYDALNRVVTIEESNRYKIEYEYDKVGNRRRVRSSYFDLLAPSGDPRYLEVQDFWYRYDKMNRFTLTMGKLENGQIVRGQDGYEIVYNQASQRVQQFDTDDAGRTRKDTYAYDANGFLTTTHLNTDYRPGNDGDGMKRWERINNAVGDRIGYNVFDAAGIPTSSHEYTYDADHILTLDRDAINRSATQYVLRADGLTQTTKSYNESNPSVVTGRYTYEYVAWDSYQQKRVTVDGNASVPGWKNGTSEYSYDVNGHVSQFYDHYPDRTIRYINNQHGQTLKRLEYAGRNTSTRALELREFYYLYGRPVGDQGFDEDGRVLSKLDYAESLRGSELEGNGNKTYIDSKRTDAMTALWQKWTSGEISDYDYQQGMAVANTPAANFRHRDIGQRVVAVTSVDFDQNFQPINESYPAATVGTYIVRIGDTLQSIAGSVWGDSSLWYLIADANGLTGNETLVNDMRLVLPNVVTNIHNNANTSRPVDPGLALGDTSPTLPEPPPPPAPAKSKKGCGVLGMVLVVAVAVVATVFTAGVLAPGAAGGLGSIMSQGVAALGSAFSSGGMFLAAAGGAIVGAAASQGAAIAMGMQSKFDWKAVGVSAVSQFVGAGLGQLASKIPGLAWLSNTSQGWDGFASQAARGAMGSGLTQGASVVTGLQQQFSWTQVAASAASAGAGNTANHWLRGTTQRWSPLMRDYAMEFGTSLASASASGLVTGVRPNVGVIAAQSFGTGLGHGVTDSVIAASVTGPSSQQYTELYQQLGADVRNSSTQLDGTLQRDIGRYSDQLESQLVTDQQLRMWEPGSPPVNLPQVNLAPGEVALDELAVIASRRGAGAFNQSLGEVTATASLLPEHIHLYDGPGNFLQRGAMVTSSAFLDSRGDYRVATGPRAGSSVESPLSEKALSKTRDAGRATKRFSLQRDFDREVVLAGGTDIHTIESLFDGKLDYVLRQSDNYFIGAAWEREIHEVGKLVNDGKSISLDEKFLRSVRTAVTWAELAWEIGDLQFDAQLTSGSQTTFEVNSSLKPGGPNGIKADISTKVEEDGALLRLQARMKYSLHLGPLTLEPTLQAEYHLGALGATAGGGFNTNPQKPGGRFSVTGGVSAGMGVKGRLTLDWSWDSSYRSQGGPLFIPGVLQPAYPVGIGGP